MKAILLGLLVPAAALAQNAMPTEFPADATPIAADALQKQLAGKVYRAKVFDGNTWRIEYNSNGYMFINTGTGFSDSGKWRTEESKLCGEWQKARSGCSEVRTKGNDFYVKRHTGEVVLLTAQ